MFEIWSFWTSLYWNGPCIGFVPLCLPTILVWSTDRLEVAKNDILLIFSPCKQKSSVISLSLLKKKISLKEERKQKEWKKERRKKERKKEWKKLKERKSGMFIKVRQQRKRINPFEFLTYMVLVASLYLSSAWSFNVYLVTIKQKMLKIVIEWLHDKK